MPHKVNAARRHHIPGPKRKVANWADRLRPAAAWPRPTGAGTRKGQRSYDSTSARRARTDRHIQVIAETSRMAWQTASGYNQRAKVEGRIGRWKRVLGPARCFHTDGAQTAEVAIGVVILNRPRAWTREVCPRRLISPGAGAKSCPSLLDATRRFPSQRRLPGSC